MACGINFYAVIYHLIFNIFIQLKFTGKQSIGKFFSKVLSTVLLLGCLVVMAVMYRLIRRGQQMKKKSKEKLEFDKNYAIFKVGLKESTHWVTVYWRLLILVRWTLTNLIMIGVKDYNEFQIATLLAISVFFQILLIQGAPFENPKENKVQLFIELLISAYLYVLICLTNLNLEQ